MAQKTMTLSDKVCEWVEAQAKKENRNFSNMVETILLERIEMDKL
jgi:hypothetical protein